ncbi:hypothetical protein HNR06_001321 [Nocardiopsis arvandica]|uniref:Uncharacterized protein n=1 Tax=Nocardiopsis sinuspersici TaxID=501010 RepID=A0A7Y9XB43_9ACTN|nr:hypothetical protein [Nocardiopsis sinuspersici]
MVPSGNGNGNGNGTGSGPPSVSGAASVPRVGRA